MKHAERPELVIGSPLSCRHSVRPLTSTNMVQVSAGLQPRGGKVPPVLGEKMSTMSLNICPATAAPILPQLRQVCSFHGVPRYVLFTAYQRTPS